MTALVVLPHTDPTVRHVADGYRTCPLHVDAVSRLTGDGARAELLGRVDGDASASALVRAADAVLGADGTGPPQWYARDLVLALRSAHAGWPVHLRLDDLELAAGSTESSADVRAAAVRPGPFEPEIEQACRAVQQPGTVLLVERDQQLPALLAVADRAGTALRLDGAFARAHWPVLRELLPGAELVATGAIPLVGDTGTTWEVRVGDRPWAGRLSGPELAGDEPVPPGCVLATIAVGYAGPDRVVTADGTGLTLGALREAVTSLDRSGVRVLAEYWLGAPCVREEELLDGAGHLVRAELPWRIAGCRPFHAGPRPPRTWDGRAVVVLPTPPGHDLARSVRVDGVPPERVLGEVTRRLAVHGPPVPSRVAGLYLAADRDTGPGGSDRLGPGTVVVAVRDGYRVVDLRTRRTFALDERIGRLLARLRPGGRVAHALPAGPARDRVTAMLAAAGVLDRGSGTG